MTKFTSILFTILFAISVTACSSPEEKAASYIENANALFKDGDLKKAEIEFKNALQINQNLPDAWYGLAKIHERKQEWRKAYATLMKIRDVNPNHVDGRIMLAQILLASNQIDESLQDAREVLEMAPNNTRAHSLMAAVQFRLGNYDNAMAEVDRALELDASNNEAVLVRARVMLEQKKFDQALTLLDETIRGNPENVSLYMMKIQAFQNQNDLASIEGVYEALIQEFPDNITFRHALARLLVQTGQVDKAEAVFERIVDQFPDNVDEKIHLAEFKNQYRSSEDAVALLKGYIAADKEEYRYRFRLGELYQINGDNDAAMQVYQSIIADDGLQPDGIEARNHMAMLHLKAGDLETARAEVDEVLERDKANENALLLRAGFKINDRAFDDAIVDLRTVLRDNPKSVKALGLLGQAYEASGSQELATESYTTAFQINPANPVIANQLAKILLQQKNAQQADEILQQSVKSGNNSLQALKLMTQIKLTLGDWEAAEKLAAQLKGVKGEEALSEQVMGVIFQGKEQQEASIDAFKRAHELAPESFRPVVALVQTYVKNRQFDEAEQFLDTVIAENAANVTALTLMGQLKMLQNKTPEAIASFEKVISVDPKFVAGYRSLAAIYVQENNLPAAEKIIKQGMSVLPDNPALTITLASFYEHAQKFDAAIDIYESMLEKNPDLIVARNNLASLLTDQRGDQSSLDRARNMAAEFKDSQVPQFRDTYAWAAVKSGINLEEAVVILEGIVKDNAQVDVYNYHLGEAYRKKGDNENAKIYLAKAAEQARPGSDIANRAKEALQKLN